MASRCARDDPAARPAKVGRYDRQHKQRAIIETMDSKKSLGLIGVLSVVALVAAVW
jgi:hypothetical protein